MAENKRVTAAGLTPAESACGVASPRMAHDLTYDEGSPESWMSLGTAAGSRGRNSAQAARQRISSLSEAAHLRIGVRSPRAVERPIASRASPIDSSVAALDETESRNRASASRARAVLIFP